MEAKNRVFFATPPWLVQYLLPITGIKICNLLFQFRSLAEFYQAVRVARLQQRKNKRPAPWMPPAPFLTLKQFL